MKFPRRPRALTTAEIARSHERRVLVYRAFRAHVARHGKPPSHQQLVDATGGKSKSVMALDLAALAERGFLVRLTDSYGRREYALPEMLAAARAAYAGGDGAEEIRTVVDDDGHRSDGQLR